MLNRKENQDFGEELSRYGVRRRTKIHERDLNCRSASHTVPGELLAKVLIFFSVYKMNTREEMRSLLTCSSSSTSPFSGVSAVSALSAASSAAGAFFSSTPPFSRISVGSGHCLRISYNPMTRAM